MANSNEVSTDQLCLSVDEAARELSVSRQLVYQMINEGTLPARKLANRTIIVRKDLCAFLDNLPLTVANKSYVAANAAKPSDAGGWGTGK
jgi:excisionase family DNA binding protein